MLSNKCPLCNQVLPAGITEHSLHQKINQIESDAKAAAAKEAKLALAAEVTKAVEADRKQSAARIAEAVADAVAVERKQNESKVAELNKRATLAERETKKAVTEAALAATNAEREKNALANVRLENEVAKLQNQLAKKSGEQLGEQGERDLYADLSRSYPSDRIERVGRGVNGGDIIQIVMDGHKEVGRIVYENKNTSNWQSAFVVQARKYRTQYETPFVMIVSRVLPSKERGMCVEGDIPVVEPRLASIIAGIMREGILEIAKLRMSKVDGDRKGKELLEYIVGDKFQPRFRALATATSNLKELQDKEKTWHESHWEKQARQHAELDSRQREINASLQEIVKEDRKAPGRVVNGDASHWGLAAD
jgi:hypothetical protein